MDELPHLASVQLPLLVFASLAGEEEPAIPLAAACTLVYLGADLLDNVADQELSSAWTEQGEALASLAGTTLIAALPPLALARLQASPALRLALSELVARGLVEMSAGQHSDLAGSDPGDLAAARASVERKSGAEMSLFAESAALLAGASPTRIGDSRALGRWFGAAAQLASDCHELVSEGGGNDVRNGRRTLPIAHALSRLPSARRSRLEGLLRAEEDPALLASLLAEAHSLAFTAVVVEVYRRRALTALDALAVSGRYAEELEALVADATLLEPDVYALQARPA
jgi:geranylgeranyl pyrophosphate synthase